MIVISCIARDLDMPAVNFVFFLPYSVCVRVSACDQNTWWEGGMLTERTEKEVTGHLGDRTVQNNVTHIREFRTMSLTFVVLCVLFKVSRFY